MLLKWLYVVTSVLFAFWTLDSKPLCDSKCFLFREFHQVPVNLPTWSFNIYSIADSGCWHLTSAVSPSNGVQTLKAKLYSDCKIIEPRLSFGGIVCSNYCEQLVSELCLSSNVQTQTVSDYDNHHFNFWYQKNHPCVLCVSLYHLLLLSWISQGCLSVSESVMLGSARGWLAGDTGGLAGWRWACSKWACTNAARRLAWHGWRGGWAAAAWKITAASTAGLDWGQSSFICLRNYMYWFTLTLQMSRLLSENVSFTISDAVQLW